MEYKYIKLVVFVPETDGDKLRQVLGEMGCGKLGNYDFCSFTTKGVGRFKALEGADPAIGEVGELEEVVEERIETICEKAKLAEVLNAVREAHPYEEPAIDVYPLLSDAINAGPR